MHRRYKAEILEQLWAHGVQPTPETRPELVHEFVNDLYRYELRRLRDRLLRREVQKADYYDLVVEVRLRYPGLALKPWQWVEQDEIQNSKFEVRNQSEDPNEWSRD